MGATAAMGHCRWRARGGGRAVGGAREAARALDGSCAGRQWCYEGCAAPRARARHARCQGRATATRHPSAGALWMSVPAFRGHTAQCHTAQRRAPVLGPPRALNTAPRAV
eukprot:3332494-Prymnesium_polylepis.1